MTEDQQDVIYCAYTAVWVLHNILGKMLLREAQSNVLEIIDALEDEFPFVVERKDKDEADEDMVEGVS